MRLSDGFQLLSTAPEGLARLRELILTFAVQGKLVSQDEGDEPASHLLEKIAAKNNSLVARDRAVRGKTPLHVTKIDAPFALPDRWEWAPLGEVVDVVRGITFPANEKTSEAAEGRIACLRTANVQHDVEWDDLLFISRSFMNRQEQLLKPMDIVMSMANSRELVGKVAIVEAVPFPEATFGGFLAVLRPVVIEPRFIMIILRTPYARNSLVDSASQTTNIANISLGKLRPLSLPIPPLAEQLRIVAKVDDLMRLCDELEIRGRLEAGQHARLTTTLFDTLAASESAHALAENWSRVAAHFDLLLDRPEAVDALEQTILQLAVRGLLVPQDPSDEPAKDLLAQIRVRRNSHAGKGKIKHGDPLPEVGNDDNSLDLPDGWQAIRFGEVWEHSFYGPRFSNDDYVSTGGLPTIRTTDMSGDRIILKNAPCVQVPDDKREAYLVKKGDLLVTRSGSIGVMALFDLDLDAIPSAYLIRIRFVEQVVPAYCLLFLNSPNGKEQMGLSTTSVGVPNVNATKMASFVMPLPPRTEQLRIVARVEELRRLCADLRDRLTARQTCQARFAETLVDQVALTAPVEENTDDLAAVA